MVAETKRANQFSRAGIPDVPLSPQLLQQESKPVDPLILLGEKANIPSWLRLVAVCDRCLCRAFQPVTTHPDPKFNSI